VEIIWNLLQQPPAVRAVVACDQTIAALHDLLSRLLQVQSCSNTQRELRNDILSVILTMVTCEGLSTKQSFLESGGSAVLTTVLPLCSIESLLKQAASPRNAQVHVTW